MKLSEQVFEFECEISGEDFALEEKGNIDKLNSLEDIKIYYLDNRGWDDDRSLRSLLFDFLITLKTQD